MKREGIERGVTPGNSRHDTQSRPSNTALVTQLDNGLRRVNWVFDNITILCNGSKGLTESKDNLFTGKGATGNLTAPVARGEAARDFSALFSMRGYSSSRS